MKPKIFFMKKFRRKILEKVVKKRGKDYKQVMIGKKESKKSENFYRNKNVKKNMHKALYDERPFLKRERWPRK